MTQGLGDALAAGRVRVAGAITRGEQAVDRRLARYLRSRPGWHVSVVPYVGHATSTRGHVRARVLLRRAVNRTSDGRRTVLTGLAPYLTVELADEPVTVSIAGSRVDCVSGPEGYLDATLDLPGLSPGWHPVTFELHDAASTTVEGRLVVVDPSATLGVVSDLDDTVIHTGLTRLVEAVRTTLLVPEEKRLPIPGGAQLYCGLVAGDGGRAPVFYVSTGAWNLHELLERFLQRHGFPAGPLLMTDWGPGGTWLFREGSIAFKSRVVRDLIAEHPDLRWVLVGDSGQDDAEAYADVARRHPGRISAIYIRDVPPHSPTRSARVSRLADELAGLGVPMLLISDSMAAAHHARSIGLLDDAWVEEVRSAVERQA